MTDSQLVPADPLLIIERTHCKAARGETGLCTLDKGHLGPHRYFDCRGLRFRLPDGGVVPFMGNAR